MAKSRRVLFLCTGNSARSQMAEALMRHLGHGGYEAFSAGTNPRASVHPMALATLRRHEVPIARLKRKDVSQFVGQPFDYVITVCDRAREQCLVMPGAEMIHWSFTDPAEETDPERQARRFEDVFRGLECRLRLLLVVNEKSGAGAPRSQ